MLYSIFSKIKTCPLDNIPKFNKIFVNSTKLLLEKKKGVQYSENYLLGPFLQEQNIVEIIDSDSIDNNDDSYDPRGQKKVRLKKRNNFIDEVKTNIASKGSKEYINIKTILPRRRNSDRSHNTKKRK